MNDFDDLFDKKENKELFSENTDIFNQRDGMTDFHLKVDKQRKNGILLAIYIVVTLIFSLVSQTILSNQFPDPEAIRSDFLVVDEFLVTSTDSDDADYPYQFNMTGSLQNDSDTILPIMFIDIEFFDADEESIGVFTYQVEDVVIGDTIVLDDFVTSSIDYVSYEISYGFDAANEYYTLMNLLPVLLCSILFFMVDWDCFKADAKDFKKNTGKYLKQIVLGFLLVYAALIAANMILTALGVYGTSQNEMAINSLFSANPVQLAMLFFLLCVFTPIVEEIVFRKVIYNFVEPRSNYKIAILLTGLIFGLMHVLAFGDFIQSIPYVFMGITFGYIYWKANKNIYVTIGVHFLNNLLSFVIYALAAYGISIY